MSLAIEYAPISSLAPMPGNPRRNAKAIGPVADSIKRFGWTNPILARREDKVVVAGHTRLEAARKLGLDKVPVIWLDLDPVSSRLYNLADNKLAQVSEWDDESLAVMLRELAAEDKAGLAIAGFGDEEIAKVLAEAAQAGVGQCDADETPEPPAESWVRRGDLFALGEHRLLCGDCREWEDVLRLFGGRKANVVVTSPPYASQRKYDEASSFKPIPPDEYVEWFGVLSAIVAKVLAEDGSYFVNIKEHCEDGQRHPYVKDLLIAHVRRWGWRWVDEFCWRNTRDGVPGAWGNRFKNAWEPVFHLARRERIKMNAAAVSHESDGVFAYSAQNAKSDSGLLGSDKASGYSRGMARPSNVIDAAAESGQGSHTAPYPVALPEFFIRAFSDAGDVVFDPFMGSGTTLIAAEKNGRVGFGTEISPRYCQVILERWQKFTGKKAEKLESWPAPVS